ASRAGRLAEKWLTPGTLERKHRSQCTPQDRYRVAGRHRIQGGHHHSWCSSSDGCNPPDKRRHRRRLLLQYKARQSRKPWATSSISRYAFQKANSTKVKRDKLLPL